VSCGVDTPLIHSDKKIGSNRFQANARLTPEASEKLRLKNYERIFDRARTRVRAWEKANVKR
jgi:hypothetical protein